MCARSHGFRRAVRDEPADENGHRQFDGQIDADRHGQHQGAEVRITRFQPRVKRDDRRCNPTTDENYRPWQVAVEDTIGYR
jgi:hypothetical protein